MLADEMESGELIGMFNVQKYWLLKKKKRKQGSRVHTSYNSQTKEVDKCVGITFERKTAKPRGKCPDLVSVRHNETRRQA